MTNVWPDALFLQDEAIEFKRIMTASIDRLLEEDATMSKKRIALELGASQADLSHWLSPHTSYTMHGHLISRFCWIVRDNSLIWHIRTTYEKGQSERPD